MKNKYINKLFKYLVSIFFIFTIGLILSGCFKDFKQDFLFKDFMVEFDDASWQSPAPGKDYPLLGPFEKGSGIYKFKVNLLGQQLNAPTTLRYKVVEEETTAEEGTHFSLVDNGAFTIEADSSTAEISIEILDFPAEPGTKQVVLELVESEGVKVSQNYKRIGLIISLIGPPSEGYSLYTQLGPDQYYNSIYFDYMNPDIPISVRNRIMQAAANLANYADKSRRLQSIYLYFDEDDFATVVAQYYGGGGATLTNGAIATWKYKFQHDDEGKGHFIFQEANGNGNAQKSNFAPILDDYIEQYEFKVDWVEEGISLSPRPGIQLGGVFRTDDPSSFLIGSLESLNGTGSIRPLPLSLILLDILDNGEDGYYSTIFIDPDNGEQSEAFVEKWNTAKSYIEGLAGRKLHKMMFYFNPNFHMQDIQLVNFYYSSANGKFIGQMRSPLHVDFEGVIDPMSFIIQNGNANVTRAPSIVDDFLMTTRFKMDRVGQKVKFTSVENPDVFFEGELGDIPLSVSEFWPE